MMVMYLVDPLDDVMGTYRSRLINDHEISCLLLLTDSKPPRKLTAIPLEPGIVKDIRVLTQTPKLLERHKRE